LDTEYLPFVIMFCVETQEDSLFIITQLSLWNISPTKKQKAIP